MTTDLVIEGRAALLAPLLSLPLFEMPVRAGFPSPADDFLEGQLDLNQFLVAHPAATFFVHVTGDSMTGAGIFPGDMLVVDRSLEATDGSIVIAVLNGELTLKRLRHLDGKVFLVPENRNYQPIPIREADDFSVWGVIKASITRYR